MLVLCHNSFFIDATMLPKKQNMSSSPLASANETNADIIYIPNVRI